MHKDNLKSMTIFSKMETSCARRGQVGCWGHLGAPDGAGVTSICVKAHDASSSAAMTEAIAVYVSTAELYWLHGMAE